MNTNTRPTIHKHWINTALTITVLCILTNIVLTVLISRFSASLNDLVGSNDLEETYTGSSCGLTYFYPEDKLIVPLDTYTTRYIVLGRRILGNHTLGPTNPEIRTVPLARSRYGPTYPCPKKEKGSTFIEDHVGFPFISARSSMTVGIEDTKQESDEISFHAHEGIFIFGESGYTILPHTREYITIPLRPVFPGFLYNTVIYSIPFAGFILSLRWFRVWKAKRRVRRGRCVACGYDITGLDRCPECATWKDIPWKPLLWAGCRKSKFKLLEPEPLPNEPRP